MTGRIRLEAGRTRSEPPLLVRVGLLVVATDLLFFSGASNFLASPQARLLNQAIVLGAVMTAGWAFARGLVNVRSPLLLPIVLWLAATTTTVVFSQRPAVSHEALALALLAAPGYFVIRHVVHDPSLGRRVEGFIVVATMLFVVAYLVQALNQWLSWWSVAGPSIPPLRPGDVGLTVGTVNAVALYLELLVPIAVAVCLSRWRRRMGAVAVAFLGATALLITGSRGAWLGAAAGATVALLLAWNAHGRHARTRKPRVWRVGLAALGGGALLLLTPLVVPRIASGDAGRLELWSAAWSMFLSDPLTGVGPGAYPEVRPETPISVANLAVLTTSHNSVLQVAAEMGILGGVAATICVAAVVRVARRAWSDSRASAERSVTVACVASLAAMAVHSMVDTQFHLPAVVIMVMYLTARLDVPTPKAPELPSRARVGVWAAPVLAGVALLVPVDLAMVRAELGNNLLDRDPVVALDHFSQASAWHSLAPYRLGEALAASRLGDDERAVAALEQAHQSERFTFMAAALAVVAPQGASQRTEQIEHGGPYDPTATVNAAVLRGRDRARAVADLAAAMTQVPPLVYSERPPALFDDELWRMARRAAIRAIGRGDAVTGAAVAVLAGERDLADECFLAVPESPERAALVLLREGALTGATDLRAAHDLLRRNPSSPAVQSVLWMLGFRVESQALIDAVKAVSIPMLFNTPLPPMELVEDGRWDADYSLRLPRWPMAAVGRRGPDRPYVAGMVTIEPVYRPEP